MANINMREVWIGYHTREIERLQRDLSQTLLVAIDGHKGAINRLDKEAQSRRGRAAV